MIRNETEPSGSSFEREVFELLRLLPSCRAKDHARLGGKDVDIFCEVQEAIAGHCRIAVECKDHKSRLSRKAVAEVLAYVFRLRGETSIAG